MAVGGKSAAVTGPSSNNEEQSTSAAARAGVTYYTASPYVRRSTGHLPEAIAVEYAATR